MPSDIPAPVQLVVETFGPELTAIAQRYAEQTATTGDWCLPLAHFGMAAEFYTTARAVLETTPVSEVEAVETVLDMGIDWIRLAKSYLSAVRSSKR